MNWLLLLLVQALALPPLDPWMDQSMTAQMVGVIPLCLLTGGLWARANPLRRLTPPWALAGLILALGVTMFWMLPRSLDLAVADLAVDLSLHVSLFVAGLGLGWCLPRLGLIVQIATGIYTSAMWLAMALVLIHSASPVCARFSLEQQQEAGAAMLWLGGVFWLLHLVLSIRSLVQGNPRSPAQPHSL